MSTHDTIAEHIAELKVDIREGFRGVNDRLDMLNGRTRTVEQKIAVLEDRTIRTNRRSLLLGGSGGIISGAAMVEFAKWVAVHWPGVK